MFKTLSLLILISVFLLNNPHLTNAQVIHETRSGDTLNKIALPYKTKPENIAKLNGIRKDAHLVLGQALLISGWTYVVQSGDTIVKIANRHAMSTKQLMDYNRLKTTLIVPGQKLTIPHPSKMNIWTGTYFVPKDKNTNAQMLENYKNTLSGLFVFDYHPNDKGQLIKVTENEAHKIAWKKNLYPYATITNISQRGYDPDLVHRVLSDSVIRKIFINNIYSLLDRQDYQGAVIDFEMVRPQDRDSLNQFIKELSTRLHKSKMHVLIAMPPMAGDKKPSYYGGYDYRTLGKYADKIFLMTYNWHWPGGPSGPIAPLNEIRTVLDYAVTVVPRSKLMLGIPQYAYDWTISGEQRTGIAYSTQGAIERYMSRESQIFYDNKAASPWFRYVDKNQKIHEVWFEDPRSLLAKFRLVKEYRLGGLGCWHLGTSMPQTEEILLKEFTVQ
ncbi:glycosyl hydrolase family 18 protein [Neobacillus cucumis]|uniref:glycosyl hydrolase family 18 protein n=1 Tax=Neobacillus cucumis TaxID=1740721 RepID=UPI00203C83B3|nr:glycosyl hydrolase family 18 protein [Neobacillus cucumis]MCM3724635.1 glycosyl hydrolase family 18 protein [Neobacillus cucumis]